MGLINDAWDNYAGRTMPDNASESMKLVIKSAFYAGANHTIKEAINNPTQTTCDNIIKDLNEYYDQFKKPVKAEKV